MADRLLAVDPGKKVAGVAAFVDGELVGAGKALGTTPQGTADAVARLGRAYLDGDPTRVVTERMRDYPGQHAKARDLDSLRLMVAHLEAIFGHRATQLTAAAWKGQVPKVVHHRRVGALLRESERRWWNWAELDARDAVALGVFALGRSGRGGTRA